MVELQSMKDRSTRCRWKNWHIGCVSNAPCVVRRPRLMRDRMINLWRQLDTHTRFLAIWFL